MCMIVLKVLAGATYFCFILLGVLVIGGMFYVAYCYRQYKEEQRVRAALKDHYSKTSQGLDIEDITSFVAACLEDEKPPSPKTPSKKQHKKQRKNKRRLSKKSRRQNRK